MIIRTENLNDFQKENLKKFILSLSKEHMMSFILWIFDNEYKYMKTNDIDNNIIEDILSDEKFSDLYNEILINPTQIGIEINWSTIYNNFISRRNKIIKLKRIIKTKHKKTTKSKNYNYDR